MGGFTYFDGEIETVLDFHEFCDLLRTPQISFPTITAAEIQDKARGDFLSKAIVILQSIWFIVQCVARAKQGLALTELELVTLALASLNGVMYYFWWDKPLGVNEPVKLYRKGHEPAERVIKVTHSDHRVRNAIFLNVLSTNKILSSNDTNVFAMLQDGVLFWGSSFVPFDNCNPHSLNPLVIPIQSCLPVTFNFPCSIAKRPPSLFQPSTHSSTNSAMSWISLVTPTFGTFTFPSSGFS